MAIATIETISTTKVDLLSIANDEIVGSEMYVQNEQLINDIYFDYIENNDPQVINDKASEILSVALQCPLAGGPAVHRARSLYLLIDPGMEYNDVVTCLQSGWLLRKSSAQAIPLGIYPNPASTEITITYSIESEQVLQIIDNFGRVTVKVVLNPEQKSIKPDISHLANGIYTIQILGGNEMQTGIGRLTILK
ncbi:MAG: T9SS type A sorting domain-containing protein [Bacteroidetes bacterium]|nr:MAG: T9SS type A sorting domain-containing protein [Bacteroidota bacterium]